jgi:hypothetical protein
VNLVRANNGRGSCEGVLNYRFIMLLALCRTLSSLKLVLDSFVSFVFVHKDTETHRMSGVVTVVNMAIVGVFKSVSGDMLYIRVWRVERAYGTRARYV